MRQLHISNTDISQFFRRMVFNVVTRNQDDHVKNISFLMDRSGQWTLAPAYDVTYSYNPDGMWTGTHQMTICGKQDRITHGDLLASAKNMGVKKAEAEHIIESVRASAARWEKYAAAAKLNEAHASRISEQFIML